MFKSGIDIRKLETLIEINTRINSDYSDPRSLLQRILESATRLSEGEASSLLLLRPENNKLYFEIALGSKGPEVQKFSLNLGEGIAGWVAQNNRSLVVNDVDQDQRFQSDIGRQIGFDTRSILAVPMRIRDRCVGVIEMINKRDGKPFDEDDRQWLEIFATQAALAIQNARSLQQVKQEIFLLQDQVSNNQGFHSFICESPAMKERMAMVDRLAVTDSSVLILGESGVGKELFAEQIHLRSNRSERPFIRVNCAALPEALLESELFGHVKGAFTDAQNDRRGRFELADGGTIFLDEIGELPLTVQAKMLRVLQSQSFEPVGSSQPMHVDVRIIAATNKDIDQAVTDGTFRRDLYYRLNVLPLYVPPLRERLEDIPALAEHFLMKFKREVKKPLRGFSDQALQELLSYSWPGNVRELENSIERAVVTATAEDIQPEDLALRSTAAMQESRYVGQTLKDSMNLFKKHFIRHTLEQNGWNQTVTARVLGIQRTYLSRLIKELDIIR
ncbi:MAG: GAF domain-containing protein [Spirochaetaceae bacterium]|nr:MAG: GAF domain-containing protein [Spirochaetaceae bacterium]